MTAHLRDYQRSAIDAGNEALESFRSALIVMPTGTGKTICFAEFARQWSGRGRVLIIAERRDLIFQTAEKVRHFTGLQVEIEMGEMKSGSGMFGHCPIVVASRQTLASLRRREKFDPSQFSLVIFDEAHHAGKHVKQYRLILDHFADVKMLGVTATPDRGDKAALIGPNATFESLAYEYPLYHCDKPNAIGDGWLVDIKQKIVQVQGLDYSSLVVSGGDYTASSVAGCMSENEKVLHGICAKMHEATRGVKTAVFCATIEQAEATAKCLENYLPGEVRVISQNTQHIDRKEYLAWFAKSTTGYMVSVDALCEGWDDPGIQYVAICRKTKSRARYCQMVGRGTRPLINCVAGIDSAEERKARIAGSFKPTLTVLDFIGSTADLSLAMSVSDMIAESVEMDIDPEVLTMARELDADEESDATSQENLRKAREMVEAERDLQRIVQAKIHADRLMFSKVHAVEQDIDPFGNRFNYSQVNDAWDNRSFRMATIKQVELLVAFGVDPETATGYLKSQAGAVITSLKDSGRQPDWKRCTIARRTGRLPKREFATGAA